MLSDQAQLSFSNSGAEFRHSQHCTTTGRSATVTAAASAARKAAKAQAASVHASRVKAALAEAGLSQDAIDYIVTRYPSYLRWGLEQKLLPAVQCWQQELGESFLSEIERIPHLLLRTPEQELLKDWYLVFIGVTSVADVKRRIPHVMQQSLTLLQGKVDSLQACGFTQAQVSSLFQKHPTILARSSEHVDELLRVISDLFGCAHDKDMLIDVMLSCNSNRLYARSPADLWQNFHNFCTYVAVNEKGMRRGWQYNVFEVCPAELHFRVELLAAQLDATIDEAKSVVRRSPQICSLFPTTGGLHVTQLRGLGFFQGQLKSMCLRQPALLTLSYASEVQVQKWAFLACVLRLSHDAIAAKPLLLMSSLPNRLGPRWTYLQQLRLHGAIAVTTAHYVVGSLVHLSDAKFAAEHRAPQMSLYDEQFNKAWLNRWKFLLIDQQLSIQEIADQPAVLQVAL